MLDPSVPGETRGCPRLRFRFSEFEFDAEALDLRREGRALPLQPKPAAVLGQLLAHHPGIVSTDELLAEVWAGEVVTPNSVARAVAQLRHVLSAGRGGGPILRTVRGRGYRLAVPVSIAGVPWSASGPLEPPGVFVGREAELARLAQGLERARVGRGELILLSGEAGIGKTRTAQRAAALAASSGAQVLWGGCREGTWTPPYAPFVEALESYLEAASPAQLAHDVGRFGGTLAGVVPDLRSRLPELSEPAPLPPEQQRQRIVEAFAFFLLSVARRAPLLLVVEDLHRADAATLALFRRVARATGRESLLLVGTYREEEVGATHLLVEVLASVEREATCAHVGLKGLGLEEVEKMLARELGRSPPRALVQAVHAETDGNPFLVRQLALHLVERRVTGRLDELLASGHWVERLGVPEGVRHVVRNRLSNLTKDARQLLEVASAFEGPFPLEVVRRVTQLPEAIALDALDELLEAQLLGPTAPDCYDFTHALLRHAVHAETSPARHTRLHRRIAEALEQAAAGAEEIARQYHRSAPLPGSERGVVHCLAAADRAERVAAFEAAAEYLAMARDLLPPGDARGPRLLGRLALMRAWQGRAESAVETALGAAPRIAESEGPEAAATFLAEAAQAVWWSGFGLEGWRLAPAGLRYVEGRHDLSWARLMLFDSWRREASDPEFPGLPQDSPERREISRVIFDHWDRLANEEKNDLFTGGLALESRAQVLERGRDVPLLLAFWAGDYRRGRVLALEVGERALERGAIAAAVLFLGMVPRCELALGSLAAADASFARVRELADQLESTPQLATLLNSYEVDRSFVCDEGAEENLRFIERFLSGVTPGARWIAANARALAAELYARVGRGDEALSQLTEVIAALERCPGWVLAYTRNIHCAAATLWWLDRTQEVAIVERNLRQKTLAPDFRHPHTDARLSLARLCALTGRFEEALGWIRESRGVLAEQGARPLLAVADFDEALLYARRALPDDAARARARLDAAHRQFEALGMSGWRRRADALGHALGGG